MTAVWIVVAAPAQATPVGFQQAFDAWYGAHGTQYMGSADSGVLAWSEARVINGLIEMFEATGNTNYMTEAGTHVRAELATAREDSHLGYYGWETNRYSADGKPYPYLVHDGAILYPIARFIYDVNTYPSLASSRDVGAAYLQTLKTMVGQWDTEWRQTSSGGVYVVPPWPGAFGTPSYPPGSSLPFNQFSAYGEFLAEMYLVTGDRTYLNKAVAMGDVLKSSLRVSGSSYVWSYGAQLSPADPSGRTSIEDSSHATIDVAFAALLNQIGVVFTMTDMQRFAETFTTRVFTPNGLEARVDGTSPSSEPVNAVKNYAGWAVLARYDSQVELDIEQLLTDPATHTQSATYAEAVGVAALNNVRPARKACACGSGKE